MPFFSFGIASFIFKHILGVNRKVCYADGSVDEKAVH